MQAGIRIGSDRFEKKLFLKLANIGTVTDIQQWASPFSGQIELAVAGNYGAQSFNRSGTPTNTVVFDVKTPGGCRVAAKIVNPTTSKQVLFFRQALAAATYDSLVDARGKEIWRTPQHVLGSTFGDPDQSGVPKFVFVDKEAIEARNVAGSVLWRRKPIGWPNAVALVDVDADMSPDLLISDKGKLVAQKWTGEPIFARKPPVDGYFSAFSVIQWPALCPTRCLIVSMTDKLLLLNPTVDHVVVSLNAAYLYQPQGIAVRLYPDEAPLLAVVGLLEYQGSQLVGFESIHTAVYIYDSHSNLIYHEVLPERGQALGVLPVQDGSRELLLVGGTNRVWQYATVGSHIVKGSVLGQAWEGKRGVGAKQ